MSTPADQPAAASPAENSKSSLRRAILSARRRSSPEPSVDAARTTALLGLPELAIAKVVAGYIALPGEPDLFPFLEALLGRGVQVLLPVVGDDRDLVFRIFDGRLVAGLLGIQAPPADAPLVALSAADVVLTPAVAADRRGRRLGRGGGSYDRALPRVRADALVIAVVHASELLDEVPVEPHDRTVGAVLAGTELIRVVA